MRKEQKKLGFLYSFSFLSFLFSLLLSFFFLQEINLQEVKASSFSFEKGETIFLNNCSVCHNGGNNIIIPEKNLKKETLEANGMNTKSAIAYQVLNGKNGMPAFGGRLKESEIEAVAIYVLEESSKDFKN
jgi:cytochrome c6